MLKKFLCGLLCVSLLLSLCSVSVFASDNAFSISDSSRIVKHTGYFEDYYSLLSGDSNKITIKNLDSKNNSVYIGLSASLQAYKGLDIIGGSGGCPYIYDLNGNLVESPYLFLINDESVLKDVLKQSVKCIDSSFTFSLSDIIEESGLLSSDYSFSSSDYSVLSCNLVVFVLSKDGELYTDSRNYIIESKYGETDSYFSGLVPPEDCIMVYEPFEDVSVDDYYYDAVLWAVDNGITKGTSATAFSPDDTCTVTEILTFLYRAEGSPSPLGSYSWISDGEYYTDALNWLTDLRVIYKDDVSIDCTRWSAVNYIHSLKLELGDPSALSFKQYNNITDVESWLRTPVDWALTNGITKGTSETTFSPNKTCTRAEIVTFLYRAYAN